MKKNEIAQCALGGACVIALCGAIIGTSSGNTDMTITYHTADPTCVTEEIITDNAHTAAEIDLQAAEITVSTTETSTTERSTTAYSTTASNTTAAAVTEYYPSTTATATTATIFSELSQPSPQEAIGPTVYVSRSGKYHIRTDCSGMKSYTEMSLDNAQAAGHEPCKKCFK